MAADPLADARRLYNLGQYEAAERLAREAAAVPARADAARSCSGRIQLERYRQPPTRRDLTQAREALRGVDPAPLEPRERIELTIGLGEALYLEDRFGAAAESVRVGRSTALGALGPRRTSACSTGGPPRSIARRSRVRPTSGPDLRPHRRPHGEGASREDPGRRRRLLAGRGGPGAGDLDRAWHAAPAGWLRATLGRDRGVALRADLDRLVTQAIIPERAAGSRSVCRQGIPKQAQARDDRGVGSVQEGVEQVDPLRLITSLLLRLLPVLPDPDIDRQRHVQRDGLLHQLADGGRRFVGGLSWRLEQQLVVHGEDHARAAAGDRAPSAAVDVDHRPLEDVGGCSLDGKVDRLALGLAAHLEVARC